MAWEFHTETNIAEELAWARQFVRNEIRPVDQLVRDPFDLDDPIRQKFIPPLQAQVRQRDLWACHLPAENGGQGFGQLRLALLNEVLGQSRCAPIVFGAQAPD